MRVSLSEAKGRLTELVRIAESGDEVLLTRHGQPVVRLSPVAPVKDIEWRTAFLRDLQKSAAAKAKPGPGSVEIQDSLYGPDGLPR